MIYILNENEEISGELINDGSAAAVFWDDEVYEKLNDSYTTFTFKMIADHPSAEFVIVGNKLIIQDRDGDLQIFVIKTVDDILDGNNELAKQVYAEHLALELNGRVIRPATFEAVTAEQFLTQILGESRWDIGVVEWFGIRTITFDEHKTAIQAIISAAQEFEGEFKFRMTIEHGKIKGLYVDLLKQRGLNNGVQIIYGHNQNNITRIEDSSEVYTALIGLARAEEGSGFMTFSALDEPDKPAGQDWIGDPEALQRYGIKLDDGQLQHYFGIYTWNGTGVITPERLLMWTRKKLEEVSKPKMTYDVGLYDLGGMIGFEHEKIRIGDTISILNTDFKPELLIEARIVEMKWRLSDKTDGNAVLGDYRDIWGKSPFSLIQSIQNTILQNQTKWESGGTEVIRSAVAPTDISVVWVDTASEPGFDVFKTFNPDTGTWDKSAPTEASEIGAETPTGSYEKAQEAQHGAEQTAYLSDMRQRKNLLIENKVTIDGQFDQVNANTYLSGDAKTDLNNTKGNVNAAYDALIYRIDGIIQLGEYTTTDQDALQADETAFQNATNLFYVSLQAAQDFIMSEKASEAQTNATDYVLEYAEGKITKGSAVPTTPALNELWLDTTTTPAIWRIWNGSEWEKFTRTDLTELSGQIGADQIAANTITSGMISTIGLDAGLITTGALTGITVEVENAGMTAVGTLANSVRMWAGSSYSSRDSAPFRVQQDGKVIASNIDIIGGSIDIDSDLYVGDNIYLGSTATDMVRKSIYFNSMANITGGGGYVGGTLEFNASDGVWDFQNHMLNYGMNLQNSSPTGALVKFTTEVDVESEFSGVVRMYGGVGMAQPSYSMYINESTKGEWITNAQETGFCGVGGVTAGINGSIAGVGVNFRIRKNYTPSSITLAATSHNLTVATNVFAIDIAGNGFWLYINSGSTAAAYRYWRGTYTA